MTEETRQGQFVMCFLKHEPELRGFIRSLLPTWDDVDEVPQNVSLVAWRKFDQFDPEANVLRSPSAGLTRVAGSASPCGVGR